MNPPSQTPPEPEQKGLILRAIQGDEDAFSRLYALYQSAIYRYVFFRVSDEKDAEDLTEEVFVRAWEALPGYRPGEFPFSSWLYRIAHNLTVDFHRKRPPASPSGPETLGSLATSPSTEQTVEDRQTFAELATAVRQLDDEDQTVIILRFVHGLPHQEVAAIIGKSVSAARVIQHRALARLGRILTDQD